MICSSIVLLNVCITPRSTYPHSLEAAGCFGMYGYKHVHFGIDSLICVESCSYCLEGYAQACGFVESSVLRVYCILKESEREKEDTASSCTLDMSRISDDLTFFVTHQSKDLLFFSFYIGTEIVKCKAAYPTKAALHCVAISNTTTSFPRYPLGHWQFCQTTKSIGRSICLFKCINVSLRFAGMLQPLKEL